MPPGTKIVDTALRIPCKKDTFLKVWFDLLKPMHKLTPRDSEIAVCLIKHYIKLREDTKEDSKLNILLFSKKEKQEMCLELGITPERLRKAFVLLRQRKVIDGGKLSYRYIPNYTEGTPYRLMYIIDDAETLGANNR